MPWTWSFGALLTSTARTQLPGSWICKYISARAGELLFRSARLHSLSPGPLSCHRVLSLPPGLASSFDTPPPRPSSSHPHLLPSHRALWLGRGETDVVEMRPRLQARKICPLTVFLFPFPFPYLSPPSVHRGARPTRPWWASSTARVPCPARAGGNGTARRPGQPDNLASSMQRNRRYDGA
ncbi:hypothetical protein EDB80DRAFT_76316 [Ilyonectria destructans]|nr:hypothetical protein EDB80DRAFT_76316 [Ilyonectria destructans]